ncbi:XRE family transcriptional regulator [Nesterenkonia sp. HG001]|uniref:helix-turn-helix domain-containing protein n=1 Tax=Nesterenkonia sp. HG001 TaxID=2983207 RepID=UPI002AC67F58|nr:XRE family transcriptional regulator [Nesterenkonia sp. HG001]MDZ5078618.1 XRE family transcriptional regulator [Nesterenkonia sp. HG001]
MIRELAQVGIRLRGARTARGWTLDRLARASGVSTSTISRLESGKRQASLELLLPLTRELGIAVDDLLVHEASDPRVSRPGWRGEGMEVQPLSEERSPVNAFRITYAERSPHERLHTHRGYEWFYVTSGRLRLQLGEEEVILSRGEAAEFDTLIPHAFSAAGPGEAEIISLFSEEAMGPHTDPEQTGEDAGRVDSEVS